MSNESTTECSECKDAFSSERGMKIHRTKIHGEWRDYDCPSCEKSLETYNGLKTHHYHAHGQSIAGEKVTCSNCSDTIRRRRNVVESQSLFFCDSECVSEYQISNISTEEHPSWNGGNVELTCDWCDTKFERIPSEAQKYEKSFCSNECRFEWKRENHPTGEDNPLWKGGSSDYYGENWFGKREETLERDNYKCKVCGMSRDEHYEKYDRDLDVHHKIPIATFGKPEDANYLINLVTTCKSCHGQLDKISRREADRKPSISV